MTSDKIYEVVIFRTRMVIGFAKAVLQKSHICTISYAIITTLLMLISMITYYEMQPLQVWVSP